MALPSPVSGLPTEPHRSSSRRLTPPRVPGRDIDAWPLAVPRFHDEQFERWLGRVSHRYGVSLSQIVKTMALPSLSDGGTTGALMAVVLDFTQFARTLGVTHHQADEPAHPDHASTAVGHAVENLSALSPRTVGRWCPACLAASGYWRNQWLEWWALACPVHGLELLSHCPNCAKMPWSSPSWVYRAGPVDRCPETVPGSRQADRCRGDLTLAPTTPVDLRLLHTQLRFAQVLDHTFDAPLESLTVGDFTIPRTMHLHALCCLASAIAVQEDGDPDDAHRLVRALTDAFELFEDLIAGRSSNTLDTVLEPSGLLGPTNDRATTTSTPNPLLTAAALRRRGNHLKPGEQLSFRCGRTHPALPPAQLDLSLDEGIAPRDLLPEHRTAPLTVPAPWVPQQLWPEVIDDIGDDPAVRCALAICLLRLGRVVPTGAFALELGLPWSSAAGVDSATAHMFGDREWPRLLRSLEDLASELHHAPPPIDYRARRIIGTQPELLNAALATANRHHGKERITPDVKARFWERFTGSHIACAPTGLAHRFRGTAYTRYVRTRGECDIHWDPTFRTALDELRAISELPVIGPLDWAPPQVTGISRLTASSWQRFPYRQLFDHSAAISRPLLAYVVLAGLVPNWETMEHASGTSGLASQWDTLIHRVPGLLNGRHASLNSARYPGEEHVGEMVAHTCGTPAAPTLELALPLVHRWPHRDI